MVYTKYGWYNDSTMFVHGIVGANGGNIDLYGVNVSGQFKSDRGRIV